MQQSFNIKKVDETHKWERLKSFLKKLEQGFEQGKIVNNIDNQALLQKILIKMDRYEKEEKK